MSSLYDELCEKLKLNPKATRPGVAKFDLSLLFSNEGCVRKECGFEQNGIWSSAATGHMTGPEPCQSNRQFVIGGIAGFGYPPGKKLMIPYHQGVFRHLGGGELWVRSHAKRLC